MAIRTVSIDNPETLQMLMIELKAFNVPAVQISHNTVEIDISEVYDNTWINNLIDDLPSIAHSYMNQDKRQTDRCLQHIITLEEFILLIKLHNSQQKYLDIAKLTNENMYDELNNLLNGQYVNGYELAIFIETVLLFEEVEFLKRRDLDFKYGDVIRHGFLSYRNIGVFLYTGDIAVPLATYPDDYGSIPRIFPSITEFPIMYFSDAISHNKDIWIPKGIPCVNVITDYMSYQHDIDEQIDQDLSNLIVEVEIYNSQDNNDLKMCVVETYQNSCGYNTHIDNKRNYVVLLYQSSDELAILQNLFTVGIHGQYYDENIAVINRDDYFPF
jgi:hypothetical protein